MDTSYPIMNQNFTGTGLPLLSGDLSLDDRIREQDRSEQSCRRCDREFNFFLSRSRICNHCGYSYCSSCSDYQALLPRIESHVVRGYEPASICAFCNDMLTITASSKARLGKLPVPKLRDYMLAYNIKLPGGVIEKGELINCISAARAQNGCLPKENERFYRLNSVPDRRTSRQSTATKARNLWHRATGTGGSSSSSPRSNSSVSSNQSQGVPYTPRTSASSRNQQHHFPPRQPQQPQYATRHTPHPNLYPQTQSGPPPRPQQANTAPGPPPQQNRPSSQQQQTRPSPQQARPTQPPPRPSTVPPRTPPRDSPPTLEALLSLTPEELTKLSVHDLKGVLFANHVNARLVVEKSELVDKVKMLVEQEREEREAARIRQEQEEREERERAQRADEERIQRQHEMIEEHRRRQASQAAAQVSTTTSSDAIDVVDTEVKLKTSSPPRPPSSYATAERNGLCVICQDEDANIAIVDCGHLCLCRGCSQIIMNSTKECPMCRTRIVTEARLLRIFKT